MILCDCYIHYFLFQLDRIVGIRSFHNFDCGWTHEIILRVLDPIDFRQKDTFLIVEQNEVLSLAQTNATDLEKEELIVSAFLPNLPTKKLSLLKSSPIAISTIDVIGRLGNPPTKTTTNNLILSDKQFLSMWDLRDEF